MPDGDVSVSAIFGKISAIQIVSPHGTVTAKVDGESVAEAANGEAVFVSIIPAEHYLLDSWTATDEEGVQIEKEDENSFIMPDSAVTITAVYKRINSISYELNGGEIPVTGYVVSVELPEGSSYVELIYNAESHSMEYDPDGTWKYFISSDHIPEWIEFGFTYYFQYYHSTETVPFRIGSGVNNTLAEIESGECEFTYEEKDINYAVSVDGNPISYIDGNHFELREPVREDAVFAGWYENADFSGDPATGIASTDTGDRTFHARWSFGITVTESNYGTVSAKVNGETAAMAAEGSAVILTVTPSAGCVLTENGSAVSYTDTENQIQTAELTPVAGTTGQYSFIMPGYPVTVSAECILAPGYGTPDFSMPDHLTTIEESAFEGIISMTVVDASNCTSIGKEAFKGCTGLTQILLGVECDIDPTAFDHPVYVFAPEGVLTKQCCDAQNNLIFVENN